MTKSTKKNTQASSENIFAQLGLPNPEKKLAKAQVFGRLVLAVEKKKISIRRLAKLLDLEVGEVIEILEARVSGIPISSLKKYLGIVEQYHPVKTARTTQALSKNMVIKKPAFKKAVAYAKKRDSL